MDLQTFIQETLTQIVQGVEGARERVRDTDAQISPRLSAAGSTEGFSKVSWVRTKEQGGMAQLILFDVALTVSDEQSAKAGIGVFSAVMNAGATGETTAANASVSRVQFSVPIALPSDAKTPRGDGSNP